MLASAATGQRVTDICQDKANTLSAPTLVEIGNLPNIKRVEQRRAKNVNPRPALPPVPKGEVKLVVEISVQSYEKL